MEYRTYISLKIHRIFLKLGDEVHYSNHRNALCNQPFMFKSLTAGFCILLGITSAQQQRFQFHNNRPTSQPKKVVQSLQLRGSQLTS